MKLPDDYKRNYRFKTDNTNEQKMIRIVIVLVVLGLIAWYLAEYFA
ncbi:hypothetical protein [Pedobacter sp. UBA4863]|nr:hypothetical protein [Pedobacter sp. UBA4863]